MVASYAIPALLSMGADSSAKVRTKLTSTDADAGDGGTSTIGGEPCSLNDWKHVIHEAIMSTIQSFPVCLVQLKSCFMFIHGSLCVIGVSYLLFAGQEYFGDRVGGRSGGAD